MSGHSHWAGVKHKKKLVDAKKGKLFSKLAKNIISAARQGAPDPESNLQLKYAVERAKAVNMTKESIARAIKRGAGDLEGRRIEEIAYEGYGPNGVAIMIEVITDNRNRTAAEIRKIMELGGGNLGSAGCVAWMFEKKGLFVVDKDTASEDALLELALEAGADDVVEVQEAYQITCDPTNFETVRTALAKHNIAADPAELSQIPKSAVLVDEATGARLISLLEELDEHEDAQNVYANFELAESPARRPARGG